MSEKEIKELVEQTRIEIFNFEHKFGIRPNYIKMSADVFHKFVYYMKNKFPPSYYQYFKVHEGGPYSFIGIEVTIIYGVDNFLEIGYKKEIEVEVS